MRISDEPLLKDLAHHLSDESLYRRFFTKRTDIPHEYLQRFVVIDYTKEMAILAVLREEEKEEILGVGRYSVDKDTYTANVAFAVRDDYQNMGIGRELLTYLTYLAKKQGLLGLTAEVLLENAPMLHLFKAFEGKGFEIERKIGAGVVDLKISFKET